jgi:hypothetical protein
VATREAHGAARIAPLIPERCCGYKGATENWCT